MDGSQRGPERNSFGREDLVRGRDVSCRVWERQHRGRVLDRYRWVSQGFRVRGSIGEGNGFGREKLESLDAKSPNPLKPFQPFFEARQSLYKKPL